VRNFILTAIVASFLGGNLTLAGEAVMRPASVSKLKPAQAELAAPSDLKISNIGTQTLTLSWQDNSTDEFGVDVFVLDVETARANPKEGWKRVANVQERDMSKVKGTGQRSEGDIEHVRNVNTCFQVRSYIGFSRSKVSKFSNMACTEQALLKPGNEDLKTGPVSPPNPTTAALVPPTDLTITNLGQDHLTLNWVDNSVREFGVDIFRMDPVAAKKGRSVIWERIADYSERIDSNVTGKGARSDSDFELTPDTNYCYRVRAYFGFSRSEVSEFSNVACIKTLK